MRDTPNITYELSVVERKIRRTEDRLCVLKGEYRGLMIAMDLVQNEVARLKEEQQQIDDL